MIDFKSELKIASGKTYGNSFVKRAAIFYWLIGIAIAAIAIGAAFYLDDAVWHFILQHQNRALRSFMHNVSRFGDWPSHVVLGLLRLGLACLPIPILIGFSRMYIGAHYLSDVVCAAVLGILCAAIVA